MKTIKRIFFIIYCLLFASPRKIIYGKGMIKDGMNDVRIRTWNGDVHLKQSNYLRKMRKNKFSMAFLMSF